MAASVVAIAVVAALVVRPRPGSTRAAAAPMKVLAPQELLNALRASPFPADELPPGYAVSGVQTPSKPGRVGVVYVALTSPGYNDHIAYSVFDEDGAANATFRSERRPAGSTVTKVLPASGFGHPATCEDYHHLPSDSSDVERGQTYCVVLVGNVMVEAATNVPGPGTEGRESDTRKLAALGLRRLAAVRATG